MWMAVVGFALHTAVLMVVVFTVVKLINRKKAKRKEETALNSIELGICDRLHTAYPNSRWRWVCRPVGHAVNGGIARIEVVKASGKTHFMDICVMANGYMTLHLSGAVEMDASVLHFTPKEMPAPLPIPFIPRTGIKPYNRESVIKWHNIVLIDALNTLINDLNASGEVCLFINQDGKTYAGEDDENAVIYDFGEMPDMTLWGYITEKLGEASLFAEVQEGNRLFISWA
jgi:hypothetical protein